ncbi:MAG: hypothetical protein ACOVOV_06165 [Dolichospermum sp.]
MSNLEMWLILVNITITSYLLYKRKSIELGDSIILLCKGDKEFKYSLSRLVSYAKRNSQ